MSNFNQQKLNKALTKFADYLKGGRFEKDAKEREDRKKFFQEMFNKEIDEFIFSEIIKKLWASRIWGNKEYLVTKIIKDNGLEKLKKEFTLLVSSQGTPGQRYERFLENVKGMGPSMVTEILCYADPNNAGIWNSIARSALAWLEAKELPLNKYRISGEEYDQFNNVAIELAKDLSRMSQFGADLLWVDYFLWETDNEFVEEQLDRVLEKLEKPIKSGELSRHDEIREKIAQIGAWLGFEIETEKLIATGAKVDCVWRARIGNLGTVAYVFEVQDRGSIDSLVVNLQRSQQDQTVQKLIIASDTQQKVKIEREIQTMPESFRRAVIYWEAEDIDKTHKNLEQVTNSIANLDLFD